MGEKILYYSTNRYLQSAEGRKPTDAVSFREALLLGQAPDEGLYMPERIPRLSLEDIRNLKGRPYTAAALLVAEAYLAADLPLDTLAAVVESSYNYDVPLEKVVDRSYVLRLDQGPTASFKDFAARMMARLMSHFRDPGKRLNVLVATSGDTGSAVGEAFNGVTGIDVYILYPGMRSAADRKSSWIRSAAMSAPCPWKANSMTARIWSNRPSPIRFWQGST